jgi:hypothetical protein
MDTDINYLPGTFADRNGEEFGPLNLAPPRFGQDVDDVFKVSHCRACQFTEVVVSAGKQKENALDLNRESCGNKFSNLLLDAGGQGAILIKGGSCDNSFTDVLITRPSGHTDIMIGGYSDQSKRASQNNSFNNVRRVDGKPVRVSWTFIRGEKPTFTNSKVVYQWGWSLLRTIHQEIKYLLS